MVLTKVAPHKLCNCVIELARNDCQHTAFAVGMDES